MADALLPAEVLRDVEQVDITLGEVEEQMKIALANLSGESLEQLTPVERAATVFTLSKTVNALFCLYLKTNGLSPDNHPAKSELHRVELYKAKVEKAVDKSTAPKMPTSSLDVRAANRFIEHAIPDLSEEQKRQVRNVGKVARMRHEIGTMNMLPKKRASGLSIAEEAAAFLAEASKGLSTDSGANDMTD